MSLITAFLTDLREDLIITKMVQMYCRYQHQSVDLCENCLSLLNYAKKRLQYCPYKEKKPSCKKCPIHCYAPEQREQIQKIMRFSGPRFIWRHPLLAILKMGSSIVSGPGIRLIRNKGQKNST